MDKITLGLLKAAAKDFLKNLSATPLSDLYGITDGKAVGTFVELQFHKYLQTQFSYIPGNAASGIDFPELEVDLKVTSIKQPQSSCPFRTADQKVYGLGYHLLVFVYQKTDRVEPSGAGVARLDFKYAVFVSRERTADNQTTLGIRGILERNGNVDDIVAFLEERNLPLDEIGRRSLAERIVREPPHLGYLTVSNALQWRLQYGRVISLTNAGVTEGLENLFA